MNKLRNFFEFVKEPLLAVLSALLITQFLFMHTRVPTGSMIPTINEGDHLVVNRIPAYYRPPNAGEVIVFNEGGDKLIKRVIAQPEDVIDLKDGIVFINGEVLDESAYIRELDSTYEFVDSSVRFPYTVPEDHYFVMGDNRKNSLDSRYFGPVLKDEIIAIGAFKVYPFRDIGVLK